MGKLNLIKVLILTTFSGLFKKGETYLVEDTMAERLKNRGFAKEVSENVVIFNGEELVSPRDPKIAVEGSIRAFSTIEEAEAFKAQRAERLETIKANQESIDALRNKKANPAKESTEVKKATKIVAKSLEALVPSDVEKAKAEKAKRLQEKEANEKATEVEAIESEDEIDASDLE